MTALEQKTSALLGALWIRTRPIIEERIHVLDKAAARAADQTLDVDTREQAADIAHQLAGSLGMYGYDQGTKLARQLELLLDYATPDAVQLRSLVDQLRQALAVPAQPSN